MISLNAWTISVTLCLTWSTLVYGCSWINEAPTDVCQTQYFATEPNQPYQSMLYTCIDGYPFQNNWFTDTPNNCDGPPTYTENITGLTNAYNCKDYPNSCGYYNKLNAYFNGTGLNQCTDQYLYGYVNVAPVIDICLGGYSYSCTNDNTTLTKYATQDCRDVILKETHGEIKCGELGSEYYNQTITHCSSANLYAS